MGKGGGSDKAREFTVLMAAIASTCAAVVLWSALSRLPFRSFFAAGSLMAALFALLAGSGFPGPALVLAELALGGAIGWGTFAGTARAWGTAPSLLLPYAVFCLYFGGIGAFRAATALSAAVVSAWALSPIGRAMPAGESLTLILAMSLSFLLAAFVGEDLRFALMDRVSLVGELQHRLGNSLQILLSLSDRPGEGFGTPVFRSRLRAMRHVQSAVAASRDFRTLDMSAPLAAVARDAAEKAGPGVRICAEAGLPLTVEMAVPVALIAADLLGQALTRLGGSGSLRLVVERAGSRAGLRLAATDAEGRPVAAILDPEATASALLRQIDARPLAAGGEAGWAVDFDPGLGASYLESDGAGGPRRRRAGAGRLRRFLAGPANRGRSRISLRKVDSLGLFLLALCAAMILLTLAGSLSGGVPRPAVLAVAGFSLLSLALLRSGRQRLAVRLAVPGLAAALTAALFSGPGSDAGVHLHFLPAIPLFALHFAGKRAATAAALWCGALLPAWFVLMPGRSLPLGPYLDHVASYLLLCVLIVMLLRAYGQDLAARESLAHELQHRLRDELDLLDGMLGTGADPAGLGAFAVRIRTMSLANGLVAAAPDPATMEMAPLLAEAVRDRPGSGGAGRAAVALEAGGRLPAEKALPVFLLAAELALEAGRAGPPASALRIGFSIVGSRARLRAARGGADGEGAGASPGEGPIVRALESQLGARRGATEPGSYDITFPA